MPDKLRSNKKLFAKLVAEREPNIPFATNIATTPAAAVIAQKVTNEFLMDGISTIDADVYLPAEVLRQVKNLNTALAGRSSNKARKIYRRSLVQRACIRLQKYIGGARISAPQLLLRSYLAIAASRMLANDAHISSKVRHNADLADPPEGVATA
jgi:hypothetical protein